MFLNQLVTFHFYKFALIFVKALKKIISYYFILYYKSISKLIILEEEEEEEENKTKTNKQINK